jgi:hypothetical protein
MQVRKPKKRKCTNTCKSSKKIFRRPKVGHLGLGGVGLSFGDIHGVRYKHDRDVRKRPDINSEFLHAEASGQPWGCERASHCGGDGDEDGV